MEDLPRKAGFVPTGGKSIKPSIISDSSLKISRVEASPSQVASVDFEQDGENEEGMPWRPRTKSTTKTISEAGDEADLSGNRVEEEVVIVTPLQKRTSRGMKVGAIAAVAVGALGSVALWMYSIRPRDPAFKVELITLDGFNLRFCTDSPLLIAVVDMSFTLHVNSTNPNVSPIVFTDTIMDIYYRGSLLGQAKVPAGDQEALSATTMELPCKMDGLELTNHIKEFFCDVTKREMMLHSVVTITGESLVWKWRHPFQVHVDSDLKVDPIFFDILDQENRAKLEMGADWHIRCGKTSNIRGTNYVSTYDRVEQLENRKSLIFRDLADMFQRRVS